VVTACVYQLVTKCFPPINGTCFGPRVGLLVAIVLYLTARPLSFYESPQVQMMYFAHDFRMYHGSFGFLYLWLLTHPFGSKRPPNWVFTIEWWSISLISVVTHSICYWSGRLFLGMKAEYLEYTPGNAATTSYNVKVTSHI
jgi:hypothetical protein